MQAKLTRELHAEDARDLDLVSQATRGVGLEASDRVIADWATHKWLARPATEGTLAFAEALLERERREQAVEGPLLLHEGAERSLRQLALDLASLPIAQLG